MARHFIKRAIKHPGAFRRAAKRHGMSTRGYARKVLRKGSRASATTKRRARLAITLQKLRRRR